MEQICCWLEDHSSEFVSALISVVGFGITLWKVHAWKQQDRAQRRAEIAGRCLVAVRWFSAIFDHVSDPGFASNSFESEFQHRLNSVNADVRAYWAAMQESILLSDEIGRRMEELWDLWDKRVSSIQQSFFFQKGLPPGDDLLNKLSEKGFGVSGKLKKNDLVSRLEKDLIRLTNCR